MSEFAVTLEKIKTLQPIENADSIELVEFEDIAYQAVVKKGEFSVGETVVYIPEQAVVPEKILDALGLTGKLAGSQKNRVKAIKLRGCLSQGIVFKFELLCQWLPLRDYEDLLSATLHGNPNIADLLGITKYVPWVPPQLAGEVKAPNTDIMFKYDIQNFKKYPHVLQDGEYVVFTEKLHGTFTFFGYCPGGTREESPVVISSKGLIANGIAIKTNEVNQNNIYVRAFHSLTRDGKTVFDRMIEQGIAQETDWVYILGESFGAVQDLKYGLGSEIQFRAFDVCIVKRTNNHFRFLNCREKTQFLKELNVPMVPFLYEGPFSKEIMTEYTTGKETVSGQGLHIREGIVITPVLERTDNKLGRVILKSVSPDYLLRKGETTEFN